MSVAPFKEQEEMLAKREIENAANFLASRKVGLVCIVDAFGVRVGPVRVDTKAPFDPFGELIATWEV